MSIWKQGGDYLIRNNIKICHIYGLFVLPILLGLLCMSYALPTHAATSVTRTICFYNPETNINNYASLKREFDTYLAQFGHITFQPFSNRVDFENYISIKGGGLFLLSSGHYKELEETYTITAKLVGTVAGKTTHKEVLSTKKTIPNINALQGMKIASASNREYAVSILKEMFGDTHPGLLESIQILPVPKDIDALMAVGFGMADAALTTQNSLNMLQSINPNQYRLLKTLAISHAILLPVLGEMGKRDDDLVHVFQEMGNTTEGRRRLHMLNLDTMRPFNASELKKLEEE